MAHTKDHPSDLHPEFLSNNSMDPWVDVNSSPRKVMFAGHLPQALVISGSEERYWQTGTEARFGEYNFAMKAPGDIEILKVINRFPRSHTANSSIKNPQSIVVYRDINTRQIGILDMRDHCLEHQYFGFSYRKTEHYRRIAKGEVFEEGIEFMVSPSIKPGGGYGYGVNLMFANMSHPGVSDDSMIVSESAAKKMQFDIIETRTGSWGQNRYALNSFGTADNCKLFMDVGERIREDGYLMGTREHDERLSVTGMGVYDTMMVDTLYDECLYTRSGSNYGGGTVVDIMVYNDNRSLPNGMNVQVEKYRDLTDRFYREILDTYTELLRSHNGKMNITNEFHRLVVEACAMTDYDVIVDKQKLMVQKLFHKAPIDDWRVEFKIQYTITPGIGNKGTGCAGDKAVIGMVVPDNEMPHNEHGERVDVIMSPDSPYNRQNAGSLYEPYFNQVTREHLTEIRTKLDIPADAQPTVKEIEADMAKKPEVYEEVWQRLLHLYDILSPTMYGNYSSSRFDDPKLRATHLSWKMKYPCIHILSPTNQMTAWRWAYNECQKHFKPRVTPMRYRGYSGNWVTTKKSIECGHKYFMLLEKISDDWIAVSTAKVQHMELLGQVTSSDKHSKPAKMQAVKALSEAELRIILSTCGPQVAADLLGRNNSLADHREICYSILDSETPTNIYRAIDRKAVPLGNNRALQLFKHILACNGYKFVWKKYVDPDIGNRDEFVDKEREIYFKQNRRADNSVVQSVRSKIMSAISSIRSLFK